MELLYTHASAIAKSGLQCLLATSIWANTKEFGAYCLGDQQMI